jgi:hypothetical protein
LPEALLNWIENKEVSPDLLKAQAGVMGYKELVITTTKG